MMGKYKARVDPELKYSKNHLWVKEGDISTVGLTTYKQRFLMDIMQAALEIDVGTSVKVDDPLLKVEGMKAVAEINAPFSGTVVEFNEILNSNPTMVNSEPYERGWIIKVRELDGELLSAEEYVEFLERDWQESIDSIVAERG